MERKKNMCLIRFHSLDDSFKAVGNLHNYEVFGR